MLFTMYKSNKLMHCYVEFFKIFGSADPFFVNTDLSQRSAEPFSLILGAYSQKGSSST